MITRYLLSSNCITYWVSTFFNLDNDGSEVEDNDWDSEPIPEVPANIAVLLQNAEDTGRSMLKLFILLLHTCLYNRSKVIKIGFDL